MAFVELDFCSSAIAAPAQRPRSKLSGRRELPLARVLAVAVSILIHSTIIWWFMSRLDGAEIQDIATGGASGALTVVDLADASVASASAQAVSTVRPNPSASELDLSKPAPLPVEWGMVSIRTIRTEPPSQSSQMAEASSSSLLSNGRQMGSAGASGSGDGGYDPYAGAAPMRDGRGAAAAQMEARPAGRQLIEPALEDVRQAILRRYPRAEGLISIKVKVSPAGIVVAILALEGEVRNLDLHFVRKALAGKKLFVMKAAPGDEVRSLPPIRVSAP